MKPLPCFARSRRSFPAASDAAGTALPFRGVTVFDRFYAENNLQQVETYADEPLRDASPDWPAQLPPNAPPEPNLVDVCRHEVTFTGGMMGGMTERRMGFPERAT
ncbi:hypothetical protein [Cribrihabitans neustonicus]|uniref:hypothetical protein n=1 Tax=Cribrihabitans neustonicus TaxID=1429085 RepID=UPI003B5B0043